MYQKIMHDAGDKKGFASVKCMDCSSWIIPYIICLIEFVIDSGKQLNYKPGGALCM